MPRLFRLLSALPLLGGCGSDTEPFEPKDDPSSLAKPDNVRTWVNTGSAVAVYANVYQPIAVADGAQAFSDPACPATADDGTTLTISGACTDASGQDWLGTATVERSSDGTRTLTYDDFGTRAGGQSPDTRRGTASVHGREYQKPFEVNLVHEAGMKVTIDYEGTIHGTYDEPTIWQGSGTITREGLLPPVGTATVHTYGEVVDDTLCSGQPVSGSTVITIGSDEADVEYDGARDCDDAAAASYSYNGVSKGKITGIACSVPAAPRSDDAGLTAWTALLMGIALTSRRRSRR